MNTSEKVNMQIGYVPNSDVITDKALIMLSNADRKKSTLIALALNEFHEKYGFKIDSKEEIHSVIANYEILKRANVDRPSSPVQVEAIPTFNYKKKVPRKESSAIPVSPKEERTQEATLKDEPTTSLSDASESIQVGKEAEVSAEQQANMERLKAMLGL